MEREKTEIIIYSQASVYYIKSPSPVLKKYFFVFKGEYIECNVEWADYVFSWL